VQSSSFSFGASCRVGNGSVIVELVGKNMSPAEIEAFGRRTLFQFGYRKIVMPI